MTYRNIKEIISRKQPGTFTSILWERELPLLARVKKENPQFNVKKRVRATVRLGVSYDNMASVQAKRATGELPSVNQGLTWGTWLEYPNFITHNGKTYLQCAEAPGSKMEVEYFINGRPANKEAVAVLCPKSAFTDHGQLDKFTVNVDHILALR